MTSRTRQASCLHKKSHLVGPRSHGLPAADGRVLVDSDAANRRKGRKDLSLLLHLTHHPSTWPTQAANAECSPWTLQTWGTYGSGRGEKYTSALGPKPLGLIHFRETAYGTGVKYFENPCRFFVGVLFVWVVFNYNLQSISKFIVCKCPFKFLLEQRMTWNCVYFIVVVI